MLLLGLRERKRVTRDFKLTLVRILPRDVENNDGRARISCVVLSVKKTTVIGLGLESVDLLVSGIWGVATTS